MLEAGLFGKDHQRHAHKGHQWGQGAHVQGNQQAGGSLAHVGAHDKPDRLIQGHHARVDEAYHHDGGGGRGLDGGGDERAHQNAQETVGGQPLQDGLHLVARGGLQAGAHHLHSVQEQSQAAKNAQKLPKVHAYPLPTRPAASSLITDIPKIRHFHYTRISQNVSIRKWRAPRNKEALAPLRRKRKQGVFRVARAAPRGG